MALRMAIAVVGALLLAAPAARAGEPLDDAGYLAFADRIAAGLEVRWDEAAGGYVSRDKGATARTNANMLLVHAGAATLGHGGRARNDHRARLIATALTRPPMLAITRPWLERNRSRCWRKTLRGGERDHASLDSQIAEALEWAWRARAELALPRAVAEAARRVVTACAWHRQWRFPYALKNQINWNAQLYASVARMTGNGHLLRRDYRRHLVRFLRGVRRPLHGMPTTNLGDGFGFHYSPELAEERPTNFDTPEYSHIVATTLLYHREARAAGMKPLPAADVALLKRWTTRLLLGNWTHAGYLNWDTGHGMQRLHSGQYWAWSMQGLLTIAAATEFAARPQHPRWAKAIFDRGLRLYARWADEAGELVAPQLPFDMVSAHRDHDLYASRMAANAMRAIRLGLGSASSTDPPPFYSYDRELQRLAVSTPSYSTAIVPRTHDAFQYGGIELARLLGPRGAVAATTGGVPPAGFGVVVRDAADRVVLASQPGRPRNASLRLEHGRTSTGSFKALTAIGTIRAGRVQVTTTHTFRSRTIEERWDVRCPGGGCAGYDVDVQLPTWGEHASIEAFARDAAFPLAVPGAAPVPLEGVDRIELGASADSGYAVTDVRAGPGALLVPSRAPRPQRTVPHPGPGVAVRILQDGRLTHATLRATLTPRG
ncbi:MAG: hypothetical protein ABW060_07420 [Solirubrobacteraceae bacterium]